MIVTTATMFIIQSLILGGIIWTTPKDCPRKYRVLQDKGGVLAIPSDIHRYCTLDYGGKWKLKVEYEEK
tara:strand:+ start:574 stop:780 length:207 start_codon:yes stop_codon:yes gene_type:complete